MKEYKRPITNKIDPDKVKAIVQDGKELSSNGSKAIKQYKNPRIIQFCNIEIDFVIS